MAEYRDAAWTAGRIVFYVFDIKRHWIRPVPYFLGTFSATCDSYIVKPEIRRRWYLGSHDKRRVCATCEE